MLNKIMKQQERTRGSINIFNDDFKYIEDVKKICFKLDMEIIDSEYNILSESFDYIQECIEEGSQIEDIDIYNFIESYMPVYTCDFLEWFKEVGAEYTDRAIEEYGEFNTTIDLLIKGYSIHMEKMFFIALEIANYITNKEIK